jgi:hypothetical protein
MTQSPDTLTALRRDLNGLHREAGRCHTWTDELTSELQILIVALEEIAFASWWRRPAVRRRWRRDVAASIRHIQGGNFTDRRHNTIATGWITRPGGPHEVRVHWPGHVTWPGRRA